MSLPEMAQRKGLKDDKIEKTFSFSWLGFLSVEKITEKGWDK